MKRFRPSTIAIVLLSGLLLHVSSGSALADSPTDIRQGLPGRRISGGSRSPSTTCLLNGNNPGENQKVVALVPEDNLSRTVMPHPTFWFALPAVNTDRSIEFSLVNQDEEIVHTQILQPTGKADLIAVSLPETAPALEENRLYKWHLSVVCDRDSRATDLTVWGWIERTAAQPSVLQQISQAEDSARLSLYEELAAWNDTLTTLFHLYSDRTANNQSTNDLKAKWVALLASQNLLSSQAGLQTIEQLLIDMPVKPHTLSAKPNS